MTIFLPHTIVVSKRVQISAGEILSMAIEVLWCNKLRTGSANHTPVIRR
ncbi:hypothetical protein [Gloeocapsa sp. PCC 7428]|nr:hypothetical protein [Gloeocapsa sp. PCC 7428]